MDTNILKKNGIDYEKGVEILGDIETYNDMLKDFLEEMHVTFTKDISSPFVL